MRLLLKPNMNRIKNGYAASSHALGIAAHGFSPEIARHNLERTALQLFRPFERQGSLHDELAKVGVDLETTEGELEVSVQE